MTIKNNTTTAVHGWALEFDFDRDITGIWNAVIVSHVGKHYVIKNASWNADICPVKRSTSVSRERQATYSMDREHPVNRVAGVEIGN